MRLSLLLVCALSWPWAAIAGQVYEAYPDKVDPDGTYLFYVHGFILEGANPRPVHSEFGVYDFPAIKQALAVGDINIIAYHREAGTDPVAHALMLVEKVQNLRAAGVPASNITLAGFSRGGFIAAYVSYLLKDAPVNTVIMAGCAGWVQERPDIELNGAVLSIYEVTDFVGSCNDLATRSQNLYSYNEIKIETGRSHGAFYQPDPAWVSPLKDWVTTRTEAD
ncbi:MAG: alpha/beta hydrolase [Aquisalinus sp.]|nr:alpha/beta hydrolase [Aquisalinus sp.]